MMKDHNPGRARVILFAMVLGAIYFAACLICFQDRRAPTDSRITNVLVAREIRWPQLHSGVYFRELAQRIQYSAHDPKIVDSCYQTALRRGPADYNSFLSYALYLADRGCCADQL